MREGEAMYGKALRAHGCVGAQVSVLLVVVLSTARCACAEETDDLTAFAQARRQQLNLESIRTLQLSYALVQITPAPARPVALIYQSWRGDDDFVEFRFFVDLKSPDAAELTAEPRRPDALRDVQVRWRHQGRIYKKLQGTERYWNLCDPDGCPQYAVPPGDDYLGVLGFCHTQGDAPLDFAAITHERLTRSLWLPAPVPTPSRRVHLVYPPGRLRDGMVERIEGFDTADSKLRNRQTYMDFREVDGRQWPRLAAVETWKSVPRAGSTPGMTGEEPTQKMVWVLFSAAVNRPISPEKLRVDIPVDARITDRRFDPPLFYDHKLNPTDDQLLELYRQREVEQKARGDATR